MSLFMLDFGITILVFAVIVIDIKTMKVESQDGEN